MVQSENDAALQSMLYGAKSTAIEHSTVRGKQLTKSVFTKS